MSTGTQQILSDLSERVVYLMGGSFILGSLVTILCLVLLDAVRQAQIERTRKDGDAQD